MWWNLGKLRAYLGLLRSQFHNSAPTLINQTHPTPKTLLPEKGGVQPQLHVFSGAPQEVLPKFKFWTPSWSSGLFTHHCHWLRTVTVWFYFSFLLRERISSSCPPSMAIAAPLSLRAHPRPPSEPVGTSPRRDILAPPATPSSIFPPSELAPSALPRATRPSRRRSSRADEPHRCRCAASCEDCSVRVSISFHSLRRRPGTRPPCSTATEA
jgi:hypothetical protein